MKLTLTIPASVLLLGALTALPAADQPAAPSATSASAAAAPAAPARKFTETEILDFLGFYVGAQSRLRPYDFTDADLAIVMKGFASAVAGKEPPFKPDDIMPQLSDYMDGRQLAALEKKAAAGDVDAKAALVQIKTQKEEEDKQAAAAKTAKADGEKFLADTKAKKGVIALPSGVLYEIVKAGTGDFPKATDVVKVNYTGTLTNGTKFDASADHGGAATFPLNEVIPGWTEGIQKVNKGGRIKLYIPSALAYGEKSPSPAIPANSTLVFEVELLEINPVAK